MIEYTVQVDENATRWYLNGEELSEEEFNQRTTTKELTVAQIEKLLGHTVKVVK